MQSMWYYFKKVSFLPLLEFQSGFSGLRMIFAAFFCILITTHKSHFRETYNVFFSNCSIYYNKKQLLSYFYNKYTHKNV